MDSYEVPEGQYLTRFFFASGATSYDNNGNATTSLKYTVGNLLDDVAFTTNILDPDKGSATLSVTKTVSGLSDEDWEGYSVTFDVTDPDDDDKSLGTITISNFTANTDGTYSGTGTLTITLDTNESSRNVTITEQSATVEGYSCTTSVSVGDVAATNTSTTTATLTDGAITSVTYTNTYSKSTESVTIEKTDSDGQTTLEGASFQLYYTEDNVNYYYQESTTGEGNDAVKTVKWTTTQADATPLTSDKDGRLTFKDLDTSETY